MRVVAILKDPKALKAAVERRLLKLAEKVIGLGHKTNPSGNNMSQR